MANRGLTPFGKEVKRQLLDRGLSQKEFCRKHRIPENRFSEILYGVRPGRKYRERIIAALNLDYSLLIEDDE